MNTFIRLCPRCGKVPSVSDSKLEISCCDIHATIFNGNLDFLLHCWEEQVNTVENINGLFSSEQWSKYDIQIDFTLSRLSLAHVYMGGRKDFVFRYVGIKFDPNNDRSICFLKQNTNEVLTVTLAKSDYAQISAYGVAPYFNSYICLYSQKKIEDIIKFIGVENLYTVDDKYPDAYIKQLKFKESLRQERGKNGQKSI